MQSSGGDGNDRNPWIEKERNKMFQEIGGNSCERESSERIDERVAMVRDGCRGGDGAF